jgi:hypothetical protein
MLINYRNFAIHVLTPHVFIISGLVCVLDYFLLPYQNT